MPRATAMTDRPDRSRIDAFRFQLGHARVEIAALEIEVGPVERLSMSPICSEKVDLPSPNFEARI